MKMRMSCWVAICLSFVCATGAFSQTIPFDSDRWQIEAKESRVEEFMGQKSLYLKGGLAWIKDDDLLNGVIEFDVSTGGERGFMGGFWRMKDPLNYEDFYIRPHQAGNPDANQYTPVFHGLAGWQLYHGEGYGAPLRYRFNEWIHVKIVFSGSRGEVFIDNMKEPALVIHEMKGEVKPGKVGLKVSDYAPAHFANFSYRKMDAPPLEGIFKEIEPAPVGTVTAWLVSGTFDEKSLAEKVRLTEADETDLTWTRVVAESTGTVNLARVQGIAEGKDTVFARITVDSDGDQVKKLKFGFSDRIKVYLNGRLIYGGNNLYRSRDYRYLGTIGYFDELYLPLKTGQNEVWMAVSESFGGWGVKAMFDDVQGIRIEP